VVTLYATLGDDAIAHGINETEATIVVTTQELLPKFQSIAKLCPKIQQIIYMQDQLNRGCTPGHGFPPYLKVTTFNEVIHQGEKAKLPAPQPPSPDDIAIIMYTSGSTGVPKVCAPVFFTLLK